MFRRFIEIHLTKAKYTKHEHIIIVIYILIDVNNILKATHPNKQMNDKLRSICSACHDYMITISLYLVLRDSLPSTFNLRTLNFSKCFINHVLHLCLLIYEHLICQNALLTKSFTYVL